MGRYRLLLGLGLLFISSLGMQQASADMLYDQLVPKTRQWLDDYWGQYFAQNGQTYMTAKGVHPYTREGIKTSCAPTALNNAFYCRTSNSIYYDDNFLRKVYSEEGDYAAVSILAHEWGHLVQSQLGLLDNQLLVYRELQADCFSGAFAQHLNQPGKLEVFDFEEVAKLRFSAGKKNIRWTDTSVHGTPTQRITAFEDGARFGPGACYY
jgi:predicted metalloprotease